MNPKKKKEYNQISKKELIENDKILLKNKFGFISSFKCNSSNNKKLISSNSNKTLPTFQIQKNNKSKILTQCYSTSLLSKKDGRNYHQYKPSLTNESTNTTNFYSSFYNSKNKLKLNSNNTNNNKNKEQNFINSCLWHKLIKNIDKNPPNKINQTENNINNFNRTNTNPEKQIDKNKIRHIKHIIQIPKSSPIKITDIQINNGKNSSEKNSSNIIYEEDDKKNMINNINNNKVLDEFSDSEKEKNNIMMRNRNCFNDNNNLNFNFMNININTNNNVVHMNEKKAHKYLSKNNIYDISSRDIKEEKSLMKSFYKEKDLDYLFISEIEKRNKSIVNLNQKKFLNLNDISLYNILSFQPEIYPELINNNTHIKKRIKNCLDNLYKIVIDDFKIKYKNILQIIKYKFIQKKSNSYNNNKNYLLDLVLNCQIISQNIKQSIEISCNYISNKDKYDYVWIFDIQKKSSIKKWISSEINTTRNFQKNQIVSYSSQISSFSYLDEIQLQINIFNMKNIINPKKFEWCEPLISHIEPDIYEKTKYFNSVIYDQLRSCEIEMQVLFWSHNLTQKQNILINEIKKIFEKFFLIKDAVANTCKYDFYKLVMRPIKTGLFLKNKFCSFDINIIDEESPAKNEIQCIYFLNMNSFRNKMDIKLGNDLLFYVVDMKVN